MIFTDYEANRRKRAYAGEFRKHDDRRFKGKGGGSAPAQPDPKQTAAAQAAANKETAIAQAGLNMINQSGPGGSLKYNQIGTWSDGTPRYEAIQALDPTQQGLYDKSNAIYGQGLDTAQNLLGQLQGTLGTAAPQYDEAFRQQQLAKMLQRQQPQLDKDRQALETQLANQGIPLGSQAYNDAMGNFNQRLNDLNLAADLGAGNEARAQYATLLGGRSQGINELTGLLGLGQVQGLNPVQTPQTGVAGTDVAGITNAAYQNQLASWNAGQNRSSGLMGSLAGLGGAALGGWAMGGFANPFGGGGAKAPIDYSPYI